MIYQDRRDAGRALARTVAVLPNIKEAIVLALPRGGVPVAFEVAREHNLPLDILVVRKLGVPGEEELAMGAITSDGTAVFNSDIIQACGISDEILRATINREQLEVEREEREYRSGNPALAIVDRTVLLVDDGLATGATMRAAARSVRSSARQIVISVPVAAASTCRQLRCEADLVVCPVTPEPFGAVGRFYDDFRPTSDDEVRALLTQARNGWAIRPAA
ncbi:MAG TPA: phosphoribosyltransferase family protein [Terracidiphilus sp.]|nr:phosphoribosyltransferase family protein [Terracidiphilus sp.]